MSPDIVVLERRGIFRGREGVRKLAGLLEQELPKAPYVYTNRLTDGRVAFLEWTAEAAHSRVRDGADSFVIEDGWIVAQTIHYTVEQKSRAAVARVIATLRNGHREPNTEFHAALAAPPSKKIKRNANFSTEGASEIRRFTIGSSEACGCRYRYS